MISNRELGYLGEKLAIKYLEKNNYNILEKNYYTWFGEIDIIAKDTTENNEIVFIEVKTRRNLKYGNPVDSVGKIKIKHMKKAAEYYLYKCKKENEKIRFDVIELYLGKGKYAINYIKNIEI